ncbi:ORF6N domain-containing protein [Pedobacter sp. KBS0701]|uniref:ORF6N domain-containing protein n=1 Tax=Pedobacter sp. KBS0701 TaxID=2578106 RepID=UPI001FEF99BF|nr:ORF6N domain-containing protein [Pedobacter sp. KBS0701]
MLPIIPDNIVVNKIYELRGLKVMLDSDLAELYGVETKRLNEQVGRNSDRFPEDFMFQLTDEEWLNLKSQFATSSWGGRRKLPFVFTEHGILMLSSVLNSKQAIQVNIQIVRIFSRTPIHY